MKYWIGEIPYSGIASIAIGKEEKPSSDEFRSYLQSNEFDRMEQFKSIGMKIVEIKNSRRFNEIKKGMKRELKRSRISSIANDILKIASK